MLFLLTILIVLSAAVLLTVFARRRSSRLLEESSTINLNSGSFRSLFEPNGEEIRALERAEQAEIEEERKAKEAEKNRRFSAQKAEKLREFREFWQMSPNKRNSIQLLLLAAESGSGKIYSETAETVAMNWHAGEIEDLTAEHLAHILESHFWLLPNEERTPGVSFWLKQEIAGLRSQLAGKK